ncbi:hypothetical protein [Microcoleus sp. B3-D7]|uniref:hypothetical protein n=1 Tax=Microcoleus sp. B3-D7 TaxID=2818659 RepID=UPI002FD5E92B
MKYSDLPEKVHDAKTEAAVDAINLLVYDKSLGSATVHEITANQRNVEPGLVKGFVRDVIRKRYGHE